MTFQIYGSRLGHPRASLKMVHISHIHRYLWVKLWFKHSQVDSNVFSLSFPVQCLPCFGGSWDHDFPIVTLSLSCGIMTWSQNATHLGPDKLTNFASFRPVRRKFLYVEHTMNTDLVWYYQLAFNLDFSLPCVTESLTKSIGDQMYWFFSTVAPHIREIQNDWIIDWQHEIYKVGLFWVNDFKGVR